MPGKFPPFSLGLLILLASLLEPCTAGTCNFSTTPLPGFQLSSVSEVYKCYRSIPLNVTDVLQHISATRNVFAEYYIFTDIAKDPLSNLPSGLTLGNPSYTIYNGTEHGQVDLLGEMDNLYSTVQAAGNATVGFAYDLLESIDKLFDAHVSAFGDSADTWFPVTNLGFWTNPLLLIDTVHFLQYNTDPTYIIQASASGQIEITALQGDGTNRTISRINSRTPMEWMVSTAQCGVGYNYKAIGPRVNELLTSFKSELPYVNGSSQATLRFGANNRGDLSKCFPDTIPVVFTDGSNTTWKSMMSPAVWTGPNGYTVEAVGQFLDQRPGRPYTLIDKVLKNKALWTPPAQYTITPASEQHAPVSKRRQAAPQAGGGVPSGLNFTTVWSSEEGALGYVIYKDMAVLKLDTFGLAPEDVERGWNLMVAAATASGVDRLLIDLTNNGGGNIGSGYKLAHLMYPDITYHQLRRRYDTKVDSAWRYYNVHVAPIWQTITSQLQTGGASDFTGLLNANPTELVNNLNYTLAVGLALQELTGLADDFISTTSALLNVVSQRNPPEIQHVEFESLMNLIVEIDSRTRPGSHFESNTGLYYHNPAKPPRNQSGILNITRGGRLGSYFEFYAPNPRSLQDEFSISPDWDLYPDGLKYPAALPFTSYVLLDNGISGSTCNTFVTSVTNYVQNTKDKVTPLTTVAYGGTGNAYDMPMTQYAGGSVQATNLGPNYIMLGMFLIANQFFGSILTEIPPAAAALTNLIPTPAYYASAFPTLTRYEIYNSVVNAPAGSHGYPQEYINSPAELYIQKWYTRTGFTSADLPALYDDVQLVWPSVLPSLTVAERAAYLDSKYGLHNLTASTMTNLSASVRAVLVDKIMSGSLETFDLADRIVALAPATDAVAMGVPGSGLIVHAGSTWGSNVAASVVQSVAPDAAGLAALGLTGTASLFLIAVDRMGSSGDLITTGADFCFSITPNTMLANFRVLSYRTGSTTPVDIETEGGNITEANGTYTICATHTSTFTFDDSSTDSDSDSDGGLWGLMALLVIPLALLAYFGLRRSKNSKPKPLEPASYKLYPTPAKNQNSLYVPAPGPGGYVVPTPVVSPQWRV